jgi:hypothetical protein
MMFRDAEGRAESTVRACDAYHAAKGATANRERSVTFDEERLAIVKDRLGDVLLSTITRETIEGLQAKRKLDAVSNIPSGAFTVAVTFRLHHACVSRLLPPEALRAGT